MTRLELLFDNFEKECLNLQFILENESEGYNRYSIIQKVWNSIDKINENGGFTRERIKGYHSISFDYFGPERFIIFHEEMNRVGPQYITYLINHGSEIKYPNYIDLKIFLAKLDKSDINHILFEGRSINFELKNGTIGNFHFKNIVKEDLNDMITQENAYFSSLGFHIEGKQKNYDIELWSNGSFYISKYDYTLFDILNLYLAATKIHT